MNTSDTEVDLGLLAVRRLYRAHIGRPYLGTAVQPYRRTDA
eukprot:SAG31_NODE_12862_length_911_cov_0.947044_2_plen_40_part_01